MSILSSIIIIFLTKIRFATKIFKNQWLYLLFRYRFIDSSYMIAYASLLDIQSSIYSLLSASSDIKQIFFSMIIWLKAISIEQRRA